MRAQDFQKIEAYMCACAAWRVLQSQRLPMFFR